MNNINLIIRFKLQYKNCLFSYWGGQFNVNHNSSSPKSQNSLISASHFMSKAHAICQTSLHQSLIRADFVVACDPRTSCSVTAAKPCWAFILNFWLLFSLSSRRPTRQLQVWDVELCECKAGWVYKKHGGLSAWPCERFKIYLQVSIIFHLYQSWKFPHWHRLQQREVTFPQELDHLQLENQSNHTYVSS